MQLQDTMKKSTVARKKKTIYATLSPHLVKKMNRLIGDGDFSSVSDVVSVAVTEFLVKFPDNEKGVEV
jgi:Arc/MetJ-type ribon-helix-helix transcriptional regulator